MHNIEGLVLKSTGSWYDVYVEQTNQVLACRLAGKMKLNKSTLTNPVAVGDKVDIQVSQNSDAIIQNIQPRKNYIARQSPKNKHQVHIIASNIDQAVLITTLREPHFKQGFIDRFIMTTEPQDIPVLIIFNKADLYNDEDVEEYKELQTIYESIGYSTLSISCKSKLGIEALKERLVSKISLFSGQSGVGKSSIINALIPGLNQKTGLVSGYTGKGTHTTTFAEMLRGERDTFIIDTPGLKTLTFNNLEILDVAHNFREFFEVSENCKFGRRCTHQDEPGCCVRERIENGQLYFYRYRNYLSILEEIKAHNYWERKKDY
ncbi:MAG TPA: ribosome small subunit-dependent GTPase A [Saprospiraceae bacterium]|nr:ribosome small subunit-dependent GTPase A [Saprospiraceae bacterium]HMX87652.1 ribosome small subunit-dependent GTPase A [Saprospiraceae bacterium]HMZ39467.1 ribosome small subunit-dependent GTPase A [Saprospiraceae bacterium]HNA63253.1 ribosome small subunit-dependent GTPase A [Saprospiraceae bacterium]HNB29478.1 ribosome small subunit-dependent GTPase A [Saprospiraceae bacterium]